MTIRATITAEADNNIGMAKLFLGAAEELVQYNAPNGEDEHHDVFRRTFNGEPTGADIAVPATAGESISIDATIMPDASWALDQLFTVAILQNSETRAVIQAAASAPSDNSPITSTQELNTLAASIYPNPVSDLLTVQLADQAEATYVLRDGTGRTLRNGVFQQQTQIDMERLPAGTYWLEITTADAQAVRKVVK